MKDEKTDLDKLEEHVDKVLSPERAMRWMVRIIVLIVVLGVAAVLGRVAWHMIAKVDKAVDEVEQQQQDAEVRATLNHNWFVLKKDAIDAATVEVRACIGALARHQDEVRSRSGTFSISRKEDREESARLNRAIVEAQRRRLALLRDYNEKAATVNSSVLGDLPAHFEVAEVSLPEPAEED